MLDRLTHPRTDEDWAITVSTISGVGNVLAVAISLLDHSPIFLALGLVVLIANVLLVLGLLLRRKRRGGQEAATGPG